MVKKLIALVLFFALLVPCARAEETVTVDPIRIPELGEQLAEAKELFNLDGYALGIYGAELTKDALVLHIHVRNDGSVNWGAEFIALLLNPDGSGDYAYELKSASLETWLQDLITVPPQQEADVTVTMPWLDRQGNTMAAPEGIAGFILYCTLWDTAEMAHVSAGGTILVGLAQPLAETGAVPQITADTVKIPSLGERLDEPQAVFSFSGFSFGLYGAEKTEAALLLHGHIQNETEDGLAVTVSTTVHFNRTGASTVLSDICRELAAGEARDVTFALPLTDSYGEISDAMNKLSFQVRPTRLSTMTDLCVASVSVMMGGSEPRELEIQNMNPGEYFFIAYEDKRTLFAANDILVSIPVPMEPFSEPLLPLNARNNSGKACRIVVEDILAEGEVLMDDIEFVLEPGAKEAKRFPLPLTELKEITCTLCVYDAASGELIFEKIPLVIHKYP